MRQAGRCLPRYLELQKRHAFQEMCRTPELAAEVTLLPFEVLDPDAAILFSDILVPFGPMGVRVTYEKGVGPVIHDPVRDAAAAARLSPPDPERDLSFVADAIGLVLERMAGERPLLGFSGAPFTLASYLIEAGGSKDLRLTKRWLYSDPAGFAELLDLLAETAARSLAHQVKAGCHAVQLFDTWGGHLEPGAWRDLVLPATAAAIARLREKLGPDLAAATPVIFYINGAQHHLDAMLETGADVLGVDWRVSLPEVRTRVAGRVALQGNLEPALLYGPHDQLAARARALVHEMGQEPGHIFNLGHGVLPETTVASLAALLAAVRAADAELASSADAQP